MIKVLGTDTYWRQISCHNCTSILKYAPRDVMSTGSPYEGSVEYFKFIKCPVCNTLLKVN